MADEGPAVKAAPPAPETNQQAGFKVVDEAPSRGEKKLVWTAVVAVIAIIAGYVFGYFR